MYKVLIRAFLLPHLGIDTSSETDALLSGSSTSKDAPKEASKGVKPSYSLKVRQPADFDWVPKSLSPHDAC